MTQEHVEDLVARLDRIEEALATLIQQRIVKDWYTTDELAKLLGRAEFTVREWARLGRIRAEKRRSGRGKYCAWVISHDELLRIERDGLLPLRSAKQQMRSRDLTRHRN